MEARTILLTSLVFALWTSTITGEGFCSGKVDGYYCEHCWQPVKCTDGDPLEYQPCGKGTACMLDLGVSFCVTHTDTECACTGAGDQCDAFNPGYIGHCDVSGLFLVETCPTAAPTCYNGECGVYPECNADDWNLTPDCTEIIFCDINQVILGEVKCKDEEYVTSDYDCAPAPPPACDGSCTGLCPNPVDCTKFFVCQGTTAIAPGGCPDNTFFDIDVNDCIDADYTCTLLDGCDFEVGLGVTTTPNVGITTTSDGITTTRDGFTTTSDIITTTRDITTTTGITTTTEGYTVPPDATCNSSTVGSKYPTGPCSQQYYVCSELANGQYDYIVATCLGDSFFDTDHNNPFCTSPGDIATCPR